MKITRIELKNFFQFKDVSIDLTYPKGHDNAGEPLEKICIIGQSGTGKTALLRLIKWFISRDLHIGHNLKMTIPPNAQISMDFAVGDLRFRLTNKGSNLEYTSFGFAGEEKTKPSFPEWEKMLFAEIDSIPNLLIHFPTELISHRGLHRNEELTNLSPTMKALQKTLQTQRTDSPGSDDVPVRSFEEGIEKAKQNAFLNNLKPGQVIDFAIEDVEKTWLLVLQDIRDYRAKELLLTTKITDALSRGQSDLFKLQKAQQELEAWRAAHPNPYDRLADKCLDPLLQKLNLRVKRDKNLDSILNLGFVQLQTSEGIDVPIESWSTGTWQIVRTITPLFITNPSRAVILMDEPERSLYPDIQTGIIDKYTDCAKGSQLFFATHSPLIASNFEPWEVIELKTDYDSGSVSRELSYQGEYHVDNYEYFPEYLRWDSLLRLIFHLKKEGSGKRSEALAELADLKVQIALLKKKGLLNSEEGEEKKKRFLELNRMLGWRTCEDD